MESNVRDENSIILVFSQSYFHWPTHYSSFIHPFMHTPLGDNSKVILNSISTRKSLADQRKKNKVMRDRRMAYGQSAAYSDELEWPSRQVSGPDDPAEPTAGTPGLHISTGNDAINYFRSEAKRINM